MDRFDAIRLFTRIVERRSFSLAAKDLAIPRSSVTQGIQQLEERLGVRLLDRSTRQVRPTPDGEAYYQRCMAILADLEEADGTFRDARPKGVVRVDVHGTLARYFMLPRLDAFFERYPELQLHLGETGRVVDPIREGFDCMLRVGQPSSSTMIGRRIGVLKRGTFASPDYLARFGTPSTPDDLRTHRMVGFMPWAAHDAMPLAFCADGEVTSISLPYRISVVNPETNVAAAQRGLGLIQVPYYRVAADLAAGTLCEVLPNFPPPNRPIYVLYPQGRQLSSRVRVFIDWLVLEFAAQLKQQAL